MRQALQLRTSQQLTLTPQLQQAIRLLQLSTQDVQAEVARVLEENPMLEVEDGFSAPSNYQGGAGASADEAHAAGEGSEDRSASEFDDFGAGDSSSDDSGVPTSDWESFGMRGGDEDDGYPEHSAGEASLRDHLHAQLAASSLEGRDRVVVGLLIETLDERGYLAQDLGELAELLPAELDVTLDDLETALVQLQHLDLPGLGARNLSECLALQLKALPEDVPQRDLALRIATGHLELLAAHDFARLKRLLHCSDDELRVAQRLIVGLNPRPGAAFDRSVADYVVPDVIVERREGKWQARVNPQVMPKLRVNRIYADILQQRDEGNGSLLATQLQEAKWMIRNLQQRFETIQRIAQAIVDRQQKFFEFGEIGLRPLVLREIAEALDLHESTISRGTTQKFMMTPRGIYEFKHFFGSGLATESGDACSSAAIRELIRRLVSEENSRKPLTDGRMSEILAQQGIVVARRTIAKYREAMNILPVNLRKSL